MKNVSRLVILSACLVSTVSFANPGFYGRAEGGVALAITPQTGNSLGDIFMPVDGGLAGRISGGYLWGDNNFNYGLESGLSYFGNNSKEKNCTDGMCQTADDNFQSLNLDLLGVVKYTFDMGFTVFAKGGVALLNQTHNVDNISPPIPGDLFPIYPVHTTGTGIAPEVAVGLGYKFTPNLEMDLTSSFAYTGQAKATDTIGSEGKLLLGLTYYFA